MNIESILVFTVLIAVGIYDSYLAFTSGNTLSKQYQKLFPRGVDAVFFVLGIVIIGFLHKWFPAIDFSVWTITAAFWGHITFANTETYEK
jgi:uncharacterized membrane protein SirB2